MSFYSLEVCTSSSLDNFALHQSATSSSTTSGQASDVTDRDTRTCFLSNHEVEPWLMIRLDEERYVTGVKVFIGMLGPVYDDGTVQNVTEERVLRTLCI